MFNNLTSLEKLYLDHNEITSIEPASFSSFKSLIHLNLANNRLNRLESKTFQGIMSLASLNLSFNPLTVIEAGAFGQLSRSLLTLELEKSGNCIQAKTLTEADSSEQMIIFEGIALTTLVIITLSVICALLTVFLVIGLVIKRRDNNRRRRITQKEKEENNMTEIPEEYITYRHFSLPEESGYT